MQDYKLLTPQELRAKQALSELGYRDKKIQEILDAAPKYQPLSPQIVPPWRWGDSNSTANSKWVHKGSITA